MATPRGGGGAAVVESSPSWSPHPVLRIENARGPEASGQPRIPPIRDLARVPSPATFEPMAPSVFSNPAGRAEAAARAYVTALLDLLGDREPLVVLDELLPAVRALIDGLDGTALRHPEAPGQWSILHVLEHLVDQETVNAFRFRSVVAEDEPALRGYDQDRWAARLRYGVADAATVLDELAALRGRTLRLLRSLTPVEQERVGHHSERGAESVAHLMRLAAGHDLVHRRQIARIRAAIGAPPG